MQAANPVEETGGDCRGSVVFLRPRPEQADNLELLIPLRCLAAGQWRFWPVEHAACPLRPVLPENSGGSRRRHNGGCEPYAQFRLVAAGEYDWRVQSAFAGIARGWQISSFDADENVLVVAGLRQLNRELRTEKGVLSEPRVRGWQTGSGHPRCVRRLYGPGGPGVG